MMTSSNGNIYALLVLCAGNSSVTGQFPSQRPVTRSFDVFFDLRLKKRLSEHNRDTETKRSSYWQPSGHLLHPWLSFWQPPTQPVTRRLWIWRPFGFSGGWWFETPLPSLWRHCNEIIPALSNHNKHDAVISWNSIAPRYILSDN